MVFKNKRITGVVVIFGSSLMGLLPAIVADAANPEPVTVGMTFQDPVTITENNPMQFGLLDVNMANLDRVRVRPNGTTRDDANRILGGTQAPADLTVGAQPSQTIMIVVENEVDGNGYDLVRFRCRYNGAASDGNCNAGYTETSVASATLLIGVDVRGNGLATVGVDNGAFDITVFYQ